MFMKICFLADGRSIHTRRWVKYFVEKGYEVHLITFHGVKKVKDIKNLTIHKTPFYNTSRLLGLLYAIPKIRALVRKINPDILHAHYLLHYGFCGALSDFHPLVATAWGDDVLISPQKNPVYKKITRFALKKADLITCNGELMRKEINGLGVSLQNIRVIYWGTDVQKFKRRYKNKEIKSKLGILNSPTIISLRNLEPEYDVESLVTAIPLVIKYVPEAKFVIAGEGSQKARLKRLVKSLNVSDSVRFVGWISHDKLPQYLASSDIYVSTSLSDGGLSSSTKEAMACELPVVVTDLIVNRQWIEDGTNGFIVPIKDPKSLADKIIMLLKDEDLRIKFGKNGRNMVKNKLNFYKEMEKVESTYKGLINGQK